MAAHASQVVKAGGCLTVEYKFTTSPSDSPFADFEDTFAKRIAEADAFYLHGAPPGLCEDELMIQRQAFAGLLWSKQFYHLSVELWLAGDAGTLTPPKSRLNGRNTDWTHLYCNDVISMPDKWE